jgi:hypothetical protein
MLFKISRIVVLTFLMHIVDRCHVICRMSQQIILHQILHKSAPKVYFLVQENYFSTMHMQQKGLVFQCAHTLS